jgi:chorismate mutase
MGTRAVRGAVSVEANDSGAILAATRDLLERIVAENGIRADELVSVVFTATPDLNAAFPARAARDMGWDDVPLMCMQEMAVPGGLAGCIRVLVHWNTELPRGAVHHVYMGRARELRPDMAFAL